MVSDDHTCAFGDDTLRNCSGFASSSFRACCRAMRRQRLLRYRAGAMLRFWRRAQQWRDDLGQHWRLQQRLWRPRMGLSRCHCQKSDRVWQCPRASLGLEKLSWKGYGLRKGRRWIAQQRISPASLFPSSDPSAADLGHDGLKGSEAPSSRSGWRMSDELSR